MKSLFFLLFVFNILVYTASSLSAMPRLSKALLSTLQTKGQVSVPTYPPPKAGILHIGVGNFHRAHMAAYLDDLLRLGKAQEWGILGAGIMSFDQAKRTLLEPQDWLQTLVERDATNVNPRILGSMVDFVPVEAEAIVKALHNPDIKIVSLTVTEGGYYLSDGKFQLDHPEIQHDAANPNQPQTIFGIICKALQYRKDQNLKPFTILSCDNIPHNGDVVQRAVMGLATAISTELAEWIKETTQFPNSMVDRITPGTTAQQIAYVQQHYGYEDQSPVFCEPFRQWVLQDFDGEKPPLELLDSVKMVPDVTPYEFRKIRILNGGHASLCYPSALLGLEYVHEAMEHPVVSKFLDTLEKNEIIPTVPFIDNDSTPTEYWEIIQHRFANPTLADTIRRNCFDGMNRQPKFIVPVIQDNLEAHRSVDGLAIVSALWCRYCQGTTQAGLAIEPNDNQWQFLTDLAAKAQQEPQVWLQELPQVYGSQIHPTFGKTFETAVFSIYQKGVEETLKTYVESKN
jgi:mannitol 2-dehydrogenase